MATSGTDKNRPGRSNSLQRMLALEKQFMIERQQSRSIHPNSKSPEATPASGTTPKLPSRAGSQIRRPDSFIQRVSPRCYDGRRDTSLPPQQSPPMVTKANSFTMSRPEPIMDRGRKDFTSKKLSFPANAMPHESPQHHDNLTRQVSSEPPKETARCHSPSWEAYERRRNEKKTGKKEQEVLKNAKAKRLSKKPKGPPPASSPKSLQQAMAPATTDANRGRQRERAATAMETVQDPPKETKPKPKTRSRSGSFVNMLRAPFEFRRSSQDQSNESTSFIGGIKLEIQRYAAQQQVLENNAIDDESHVHPALRKGKQESQWTAAPLKSPLVKPGSSDGTENHRRYPPCARNNHLKPSSMISFTSSTSSTSSSIPDASQVQHWRTKMGVKAAAQPGLRVDSSPSSENAGPSSPRVNDVRLRHHSPELESKGSKGSKELARNPDKMVQEKMHIARTVIDQDKSRESERGTSKRTEPYPPEKRQMQHSSNNDSISSTSSGATGYKTAPSSPQAPEPPRRSTKRYPWSPLNEPKPPAPPAKHHGGDENDSTTPDSRSKRSFSLLRGNGAKGHADYKPSPSDQMERTFVKTSPSTSYSMPFLPSPRHSRNQPTSSSEESCSEDFHYTSSVSTPATSRPQSEQEMSLVFNKGDTAHVKLNNEASQFRCSADISVYPSQTMGQSEDEAADSIQAAAEKVLAVFNEIPVKRPGLGRRCNSQSSIATDVSFAPSAREQPLRLVPRNNKTGTQAQTPPSPGSRLQEARKYPPAVPLARSYKHRFGPPPSFQLPDDSSDATDDTWAPAPPARNIMGRLTDYKSTPHLKTCDREPMDKVFVECCSCRYYHDLPSHLYEAMANPEGVLKPVDKCGFVGALSMTVRCSWCKHEMSVRCCSGLATTVYIKERLH